MSYIKNSLSFPSKPLNISGIETFKALVETIVPYYLLVLTTKGVGILADFPIVDILINASVIPVYRVGLTIKSTSR